MFTHVATVADTSEPALQARSFCPINGTRLTGQVKRKAEVEVPCFEEDQDHGDQGTGSKRKKTKAEETVSFISEWPLRHS